ncbi:hypothetical protein [Proteiniborus sp.]|uniref:hypothetical protein n=1 Tax=Proteiniborus sp. TaxID=2079015 RepID=UPI00332E6309
METNKMNKLFLILGIGIGLLVSSMLNIAYPKTKYISYTETQIIEKARELGMVSLKESIIEKEEKNLETSNKTSNDSDFVEDKRTIEFIINKGDNSEEIVDKLFKEGIIEDKEEFTKKVIDNDIQKKFKYGVYELETKMEYDFLIEVLTGKNF